MIQPKVRKTIISLSELMTAKINPHTTLVIPPSKKLLINETVLQKLNTLVKHERNTNLTIC